MFGDLRFAFRVLRRDWAFTLLVVSILALGIGANSAVFSLFNAVLLRDLPYRQAQELVLFWEYLPQLPMDFVPISEGGFVDWQQRSDVFESMAAFRNRGLVWTGQGEARRVQSLRTTANLFSLLGTPMLMGSGFAESDGRPGAEPVTILSHEMWQEEFGGDRQVIGRTLVLDGQAHTVVGVLPPGFFFPPPIEVLGSVIEFQPDLFTPLIPDPNARGARGTFAVARLKAGVTRQSASQRLQVVAQSLIEDFPANNPPGLKIVLSPIHEQGTARSRGKILFLFGGVGLVLLIACFNVANLLLVRAASRRREIAIRSALGAAGRRILRQLLTESMALALLGSLAGVFVAYGCLRFLLQVGAGHIPMLRTVSIDSTVLGFTLVLALVTGLLFGSVPFFQIRRLDLSDNLKEGGRGEGSSALRGRFRDGLIMVEVALAVMLLVGAGLLIESYRRLQGVELGFKPNSVLSILLTSPPGSGSEVDVIERAIEEVRAIPGIRQVGATSHLPLAGSRGASALSIQGRPTSSPEEGQARLVDRRVVEGDYFQSMGVVLLDGRFFDDQDRLEGRVSFIINQTVARRFWPDTSPVGQMVALDQGPDGPLWGQIVGIVEDVRNWKLESDPTPAVYAPRSQSQQSRMFLVLRSDLPAESLTPVLRSRLAAVDPRMPFEVRPMDTVLYQAQSDRRSPMLLFLIFAGLALALAIGGLYGVLSYLVGRRQREIGVRMALGATPREVGGLVLRQTFRLTLGGLLLGLGAALAFSRWLDSLLFQVQPGYWVAYLTVIPVLLLTALLAAYLPVRRASRVDPVTALRRD